MGGNYYSGVGHVSITICGGKGGHSIFEENYSYQPTVLYYHSYSPSLHANCPCIQNTFQGVWLVFAKLDMSQLLHTL